MLASFAFSSTPKNKKRGRPGKKAEGIPSTADTHNITDNSESPDCPSVHFNTSATPEERTPRYSV